MGALVQSKSSKIQSDLTHRSRLMLVIAHPGGASVTRDLRNRCKRCSDILSNQRPTGFVQRRLWGTHRLNLCMWDRQNPVVFGFPLSLFDRCLDGVDEHIPCRQELSLAYIPRLQRDVEVQLPTPFVLDHLHITQPNDYFIKTPQHLFRKHSSCTVCVQSKHNQLTA